MICHQAKYIQTHTAFLDRHFQTLQKTLMIVLIIKDYPPIHSANRYVINCTLKLNA